MTHPSNGSGPGPGATAAGMSLAGEGGPLAELTRRVLESALEGEMTDHLRRAARSGPAGAREVPNRRNGYRFKAVTTEAGRVEIAVPRDRWGTFEPKLLGKRRRRLGGVDEMVLSLSAKGLTHREVSAHLRERYGAQTPGSTIAMIADSVLAGMAEWQNRPLDAVYPVVFVDSVRVPARAAPAAHRTLHLALGVTAEGSRDLLGLWAQDARPEASYWQRRLTEIRNRGVGSVLMVVSDELAGLPQAVNTVWPSAVVHTCLVRLLRLSLARPGHR
jgi:putative transposase